MAYGTSNNWRYGVNMAGNVADLILDANVVRAWEVDGSPQGLLLKSLFEPSSLYDLGGILGLLNVKYVLQENDLEWRYSPKAFSPSFAADFLTNRGLSAVKEFGKFTPAVLATVLNEDSNENIRYELLAEVINKPALVVYDLGNAKTLPLIYTSTGLAYSDGDSSDMKNLVSLPAYDYNDTVYQNTDSPSLVKQAGIFFLRGNKLPEKELALPQGLTWPEATVSPDTIEYYLVLLEDWTRQLDFGKSYEQKIGKLMLSAAKRTVEVYTFGDNPKVVTKTSGDYLAVMRTMSDIFLSVPGGERDKDYEALVDKFLTYSSASYQVFHAAGASETTLSVINELHAKVSAQLKKRGDDVCAYCFRFSVPTAGTYDVFIDTGSFVLLKPSEFSLTEVASGKSINATIDSRNFAGNAFWRKLGEAQFSDGLYDIKLNFSESISSLSYIYDKGLNDSFLAGKFDPSDIELVQEANAVVIEPNAVLYIPITEWDAYQHYKISFDYTVLNGELWTILTEKVPDYKMLYEKGLRGDSDSIRLMNSKEMVTPASQKAEGHFEKEVTARRDAQSAFLYVYIAGKEGLQAKATIRNLRAGQVINPKIYMTGRKVKDEKRAPKVVYQKINTSKYKVFVEGVSGPYTLVFGESFNEGWKLVGGSGRAVGRHALVNGFANGWYVDNNSEGTIYMEFAPQKGYIILLILVLVVFAGSAITAGYLTIKEGITKGDD